MTGQRLPQAYRSRPRPSSALSAKASTVCPCSLDQKNTGKNRCRYGVFKVRAGLAHYEKNRLPLKRISRARSLKTQQRTKNNVEVDVLLGELNSRTNRAVKAQSIERVQRLPE